MIRNKNKIGEKNQYMIRNKNKIGIKIKSIYNQE